MYSEFLSDITAVIPIGGKGTRLSSIIGKVPKPIYPILGKSTLLRACEALKEQGIHKIFITIGYEYQQCLEHIQFIKNKLNIEINCFKEEHPLGECGALWQLKNQLSLNFLFINGDLIFSMDLKRLLSYHKRLDSDLTLVTHTSNHPFDSDLISAPNGSLVEKLFLKSNTNHFAHNAYLGYSAIALIDRKLLSKIKPPINIKSSSLFHHLVQKAFIGKSRIYSYNTTEYIKDMGTPKRFEEVQKAIKKNILNTQNYKNKQNALFIDRDNTLIRCKESEYILHDSEIIYLIENIKKIALKSKDYSISILVTNQPQISMGYLTIEELEEINSKIISFCLEYDLKIDIITFCPHHPHKGFESEISNLKVDCFCRKPQPGMLFEQAFLRNIDLNKSLMIGDSLSDQNAAMNAGCKFCYIDQL